MKNEDTEMRKNTLRKILSVLVDGFGYEEVRKSLDGLGSETTGGKALGTLPGKRGKASRPRTKPSAITAVESLSVSDEEKKDDIMELARKLEEKEFMPNVNHVRAFLRQQGKDGSSVKSRQQAVSIVFKCLAGWETQNLRELDVRGAYGGPKSLSVIAESIEQTGQQNRL